MDDFKKFLIVILVIVYIISPVDVAPGPVDDVIVALLGAARCKKISEV